MLGRPWEFDLDVAHHGTSNKYSFMQHGNNIVLLPLTPAEIQKFENERQLNALDKSQSHDMLADVKKKELALLVMHNDLAAFDDQDARCYILPPSLRFVVPNLLQVNGDGIESRTTLIQGGEDDAGITRMESMTTPIQEGEDDENITTSDTYTLKFQSPSNWTLFPSRIPETVCTKNNVTVTYGVHFGSSLYGWKDNFVTFRSLRIEVYIYSESTAIDKTRRRPESAWVLRHHFWAEGPCITLEPIRGVTRGVSTP